MYVASVSFPLVLWLLYIPLGEYSRLSDNYLIDPDREGVTTMAARLRDGWRAHH